MLGTGTASSEGGPGKRTGREALTAPPVDPHLERLDEEVKRRTGVVGVFPDGASLLLLASCVLIEAHHEWQVDDRRSPSENSTALLDPPEPTVPQTRRTELDEVLGRGDRATRPGDGIVGTTAEQHADHPHHPTGRDPWPRSTNSSRVGDCETPL